MSRPLILLLVLAVLGLIVLFGLAALDRPVPLAHVEQPVVANATAQ